MLPVRPPRLGGGATVFDTALRASASVTDDSSQTADSALFNDARFAVSRLGGHVIVKVRCNDNDLFPSQ